MRESGEGGREEKDVLGRFSPAAGQGHGVQEAEDPSHHHGRVDRRHPRHSVRTPLPFPGEGGAQARTLKASLPSHQVLPFLVPSIMNRSGT